MSLAPELTADIAGLQATVVGPTQPVCVLVLLHGYAMNAESLTPFAHSLRPDIRYYLPQGPMAAEAHGRAWWPIDGERRAAVLNRGARDLADEFPPGRESARRRLGEFLQTVAGQHPDVPLILAGFSQGGMLACDTLLFEHTAVRGLALMSASRIAFSEWQTRLTTIAGLPVFISHGVNDPDLSFSAGEKLRDSLQMAGAEVTWTPFAGGHEIPLTVWRQFRKFIANVLTRQA